jgi:hypothetical protein
MHVPKTGGTSLRASLQQAFGPVGSALLYPPADLAGAISRGEFDAMPGRTRDELRLVMGHFRYGIHRQLGRPWRYATLVRDPVERIVSLYYHYRNLPGVRRGSREYRERLRLRWRRVSLGDWVFKERRVEADNIMVRYLVGGSDFGFGRCSEELFQQAMANVEREFIGLLVTEDMQTSTAVLGRLIGRDLAPVAMENTNPRRLPLEEIDPAVLERIRDLNRYDLRLHEAARAWLAQQRVPS